MSPLTSDSTRPRHRVPSPRDRCRSFLLIFTLFLLFSICLAIGLSYIDNNQVYFMRWLSFSNIDFSHGGSAPSTWEDLKGGEHCLRYATREYTARLSTNSVGQEAMRACKETPTEIHGRILQTNFCQDLGLGRGVWGFWIVVFDEPVCQTKWDTFVDLGCEDNNPHTEMSLRRIEAHLENLQIGADWRIMCTTTPADIRGRHFFTPAECFHLVFRLASLYHPSLIRALFSSRANSESLGLGMFKMLPVNPRRYLTPCGISSA